jgi:hypothetical protein
MEQRKIAVVMPAEAHRGPGNIFDDRTFYARHSREGGNPVKKSREATNSELDTRLHRYDENPVGRVSIGRSLATQVPSTAVGLRPDDTISLMCLQAGMIRQ